MENLLMYLLFAVGVVLIVKGGDWFVDGAVWVAEVTGIPKFIIGATIISLATTLPEVIVSTIAAVEGHGILVSGVGDYIAASQGKVGMAIGNGIGSVICNTAMILAINIIFMPLAIKRREFAPKSLLLVAAVVVLFACSLGGAFTTVGAAVMIFIFALYIIENIRSAKDEAAANDDERPAKDKKSVITNILRVVVGAAGIVAGSQLLVNSGSEIAASWGVSEAIIGVTIIAIGTSLPESDRHVSGQRNRRERNRYNAYHIRLFLHLRRQPARVGAEHIPRLPGRDYRVADCRRAHDNQ